MKYDLTIQRHQIVKTAQENGWQRVCTPNYDVFGRNSTEITVSYFGNGGRVQGANIGSTDRAYRTPAGPRGKLAAVLVWLQAPGPVTLSDTE